MLLTDYEHRHPSVVAVLRFFTYEHLPEHVRPISEWCANLAEEMVETLPDDPELTVGLRKLLEAKDAFVRTAVASRG